MTPQFTKFPDAPKASSREHWIDISRFLAAYLIVCVHAPAFSFSSMFQLPVFNGRVAFFLILAGYFMGQENSWGKAVKRFVTLLIPFLFWNVIISFFYPGKEEIMNMGVLEYLCNLVGFRSFFTPDLTLPIDGLIGRPFSPATWFLRDIILCSLISPLLLKFKYPVYALILICFCTDLLDISDSLITLSPQPVATFCLGLLLSSIKLASVKTFYRNSFTPYVLLSVGIGFLLSITNYLSVCQNNPEWNMHKILASYGV